MMIAIMAVYLVLLFALVRFGIVSFNLFWKSSPFIVLLLLNLLLVANAAIPRGGKLVVTLENLDTEPRFALAASGPMLRVPPKFLELHSGNKPEEPIDAHTVQPYYTLLLAREANMTISIHATAEEIVLSAFEWDSGEYRFDPSNAILLTNWPWSQQIRPRVRR